MTDKLNSEHLVHLSREKSVRGAVVRQAWKRAEDAGPEQLEVLEEALQLLLDRFHTGTGDK